MSTLISTITGELYMVAVKAASFVATGGGGFNPNGDTERKIFDSDAFKLVQRGFLVLGIYLAIKFAYDIFKSLVSGSLPDAVKTGLKAIVLCTFCFNIALPLQIFTVSGSLFTKLINSVTQVFG
jgi:hypothetical protein